MDRKVLQRLVDQAKSDPKFLHALVFDPESVLKQLDYLDRNARAKLVGNDPIEVLAGILGSRGGANSTHDNAP